MTSIGLERAMERVMSWRSKALKVGAALATAIVLGGAALPAEGLNTRQLEGRIGPYRIGMQLRIRDYVHLEGGHYFYVKHLVNIPLEGRIDGDQVILKGQDGGVFKLHLVSESGKPGEPLNFYNSTGLAGVWTHGVQTLPVEIGFGWNRPGAPTRLYDFITDASDAEFEAMVRRFIEAVLRGDRAGAAALVSYPLNVNDGPYGRVRHRLVRNKAALLAQWDSIFTPGVMKELGRAVPHEMFTRDGMASVGLGVVYFDAKGAQTINVGDYPDR